MRPLGAQAEQGLLVAGWPTYRLSPQLVSGRLDGGKLRTVRTRLLEHPAVVEKVDFEGPRDVLLAYQGPAVSQEGSENR